MFVLIKRISCLFYSKTGLSQLAHNIMAVRKINNSWRIDIRHNHVRYRRKSPENSKLGAQAYEAVLRHKLTRGETLAFDKPDEKQKKQEQKFKDFAWTWVEVYTQSEKNKHSEKIRKKYALRTHLVPFFGETQIDKISTYQVVQYKAKKTGEGLSAKTVNNHLTVLSTCLRSAQEWHDLKNLPKMKPLKEDKPGTDFLSQGDSEKLVANSTGMWQDVIFTVLKTGLRRGELKALKWSNINWDTRILTVSHSWCVYKKGLTTPKGRRERHIPLTDELYKRLLQRRKEAGFVFRSEKTQSFSNKMLAREIDKACKKAGIKRVTCHDLRHTFASHLAMAGATLKAIQELLGHVKIETTLRYTHLMPSFLRETVDLLEPVKGISQYFGHYMGTTEKLPLNIPSQQSTAYSKNPYVQT